MNRPETKAGDDARIAEILDLIMRFARGELAARGTVSNDRSSLDGVVAGINILGEELEARIAQLQETQRHLIETDQLFHSIFEAVQDGIIVADVADWSALQANGAICRMLGYSLEELMQAGFDAIHPASALAAVRETFRRMDSEGLRSATVPMLRKDGHQFRAEVTAGRLRVKGKHCLVGVFRDLSESERAAEAEELARHDGLTGLHNHRSCMELLGTELSRSQRHGTPLSLLMIDIDHFKLVNDNLGHQAGDAVLRQVGALLQDRTRSIDHVCRYGGEEFSVILPMTGVTEAMDVAERIRAFVQQHAFACGDTVRRSITISIGVAGFPLHAQTQTALLAAADTALYASKRAGRNHCSVYEAAAGTAG